MIFYNQSENSKNLSDEFLKHFEKLKDTSATVKDLNEVQQDVDEEFQNTVNESHPQAAILFPDANNEQQFSVALKITKANANQISDPKKDSKLQRLTILGETALYESSTLKDGKEAVEGLILAVPWFQQAPEAKIFVKNAKLLWGKTVGWTVGWRTATSYDATQALIKALSANPSRSTILQNLRQINLKAGDTSGYPLQFTQDGERQNKPILLKVEKSKFQLLPEGKK